MESKVPDFHVSDTYNVLYDLTTDIQFVMNEYGGGGDMNAYRLGTTFSSANVEMHRENDAGRENKCIDSYAGVCSALMKASQENTLNIRYDDSTKKIIAEIARTGNPAYNARYIWYRTRKYPENLVGHFTIITSPCVGKNRFGQIVEDEINDSLFEDTKRVYEYLSETKKLLPSPWSLDHGVLEANRPNKLIQSVPQFEKEVKMLSHLQHDKNVVIFYSGHGNPGNGNWYLKPEVEGKHSVSYLSYFNFMSCRRDEDPTVSYHDFMSWWRNEDSKKLNLTLFLDSCFAGEWARCLKRDNDMDGFSIAILCASDVTHTCFVSSISCGFCFCGETKESQYAIPGDFVEALINVERRERFVYAKTASYSGKLFSDFIDNLREL